MIAGQNTLTQYVLALLEKGEGREQIEILLQQQGHDELFTKSFVAETIKLRYARRRSQGLTLVLVGAVICFLSFLLTIAGALSHDSFPWVLYGLTSIGVLVVFAGFVKIF